MKENKRYALYRTKDDPEGKRIRRQPYRDLGADRQYVNMDHYLRVYMGEYEGKESLKELMVKIRLLTKDILAEPVRTSDVLMLNRDGEPVCYYIDGDSLKLITKFIRPSSGGTVIDDTTKGVVIEGKAGKWDTVDSAILDGRIYYLMENQKYKDTAAKVIVDSGGKLLVDDVSDGFGPAVKQQIQEMFRQTDPLSPHEKIPGKSGQKKDMLIWQRPYENGTWERRAESGTEANYDMVDGLANNPVEAASAVKEECLKQQNGPKRRTSVIRKLRRKQIEIARKSGKSIPAYLQEERDRK
ncbi:MAG: DUF4316 domain-containing protein [Eubacterium sp.]|nr:DUF4316 domain-containing protein [Eubacterium sp.]